MAAGLLPRLSSICKLCRGSVALARKAFKNETANALYQQKNIFHQARSLTLPLGVIEFQKKSTSAALVQDTNEEIKDKFDEKTSSELLDKVKSAIIEDQHFRRIFAVVHFGGRQHKIATNDIIMVHKIPAKCGDKIKLQKILMVGGREFSLIGKPLLSTGLVHIEATVLEKTKGRKIIVFKKKRRKNWKKWQGHRQELTVLRINKINVNHHCVDGETLLNTSM